MGPMMWHVYAVMLGAPEEAAESEPAWKGAGQEVGLQIWRIVVSMMTRRTVRAVICVLSVGSWLLFRNDFYRATNSIHFATLWQTACQTCQLPWYQVNGNGAALSPNYVPGNSHPTAF